MAFIKIAVSKIIGIPEFGSKKKIPSVNVDKKTPLFWDLTVQKHEARKLHYDLRLSDGKHAYSWALPEGLPEAAGQSRLAVRQSDHAPSYMSYEGTIEEGYGKGKVSIDRKGQAQIISADATSIKYIDLTGRRPSYFLLTLNKKSDNDDWYIINITPTEANKTLNKPAYKEMKIEDVKERMFKPDVVMQEKVDGAHTLTTFKDSKATLYSYRVPKQGKIIDHSVIGNVLDKKISSKLHGVTVRHETYFEDKNGKAVSATEVARILNTKPGEAVKLLDKLKYKPKHMIFDVVSGPKFKKMDEATYKEKVSLMKQVVDVMKDKGYHLPDMAETVKEKEKLLTKIQKGKHPRTVEGFVLHSKEVGEAPIKVKFKKVYDVYVKNIFEGEGRLKGSAGGFEYSLTSGGPVVGKVGTGFSDTDRKDMWKNKKSWVGTKVVLNAQEQFPSGALRAPSFLHKHM